MLPPRPPLSAPWNVRTPQSQVLLGLLLLVIWVGVGTLGFMVIERWPFLDAFYMTVITISTVGFEEVHPLSPMGELFATFLIVVGLGTAVYTFTRLGQLVMEGELMAILGRRRMRAELQRLRDHFIVCGFGRIGHTVTEGLVREGIPFCVIDQNPALEEELQSLRYLYLIADATDEAVLREAGIDRARGVLALLPSDADNLFLTITAKELNPRVQVIARALDERAEVRMKRVGADQVIAPYRIAGQRILHAAVHPTLLEFLELATHREYLPLSLEEVRVEPKSALAGVSLAGGEVRRRYGVIVIAIKRATGEMVFNPDPAEVIYPGDTLVALGREEDLKRLEAACLGVSG